MTTTSLLEGDPEYLKLRAEIERLNKETVTASYHLYEITKLEIEVERLRAFAQWVADNSNDPHVVARARFWSRPALEPKP